jgi:hypothetical protein
MHTCIARYICIWIVLLPSLTACSVLPSVKNITQSPWKDFSDAKASYDKIIPGKTTLKELQALGIDPAVTPNVRRLNYVDVLRFFLPNESVHVSDLDPQLRHCVDLGEECYGYEVEPGHTFSKRHGNAFLDVLGFRRRTTTNGWKFTALVVISRDVVAYKIWSGEPKTLREEDSKKPLGPFQELGPILQRGVGP